MKTESKFLKPGDTVSRDGCALITLRPVSFREANDKAYELTEKTGVFHIAVPAWAVSGLEVVA